MISCIRRTMTSLALNKLKKKTPSEKLEKPKKKIDRFDGLSEEEVQKYTLSDYLEMNLDIVFVGINPSLMAAHRGRYYAGSGNHFYKLLHESQLVPRYVSFEEDYKLLQYSIGLTNIVGRATRSSADLKKTEIKEGAKIVEEKLRLYKPRVAVFNGKCIYEVFANKTGNFNFGLQPERIGDTAIWVIPSSSARCAHFPRMVDKLHFYTALKRYVQFLKGEISDVDVKEFWFDGKCKQYIPSTSKMWRRKNMSAFLHGGRVANKDTVCLDTSDENVAIAYSTEFIVKEIKSLKHNEDKEEPSKDETENREDFPALDDVGKSCDNDMFPKKEDDISKVQCRKDFISNDDLLACNSIASKIHTNNHRTNRKIKRLSPKPTKLKSTCEGNASSDFMSLIKQRLQKKADVDNSIKNEDSGIDSQVKCSTIKSKLERFNSKDVKESITVHESPTSE